MPTFDFDAYIASRAAADNKLQEVINASREKQAQLQVAGQEKTAELDKSSWVSQLGLDPGGFIANRINDAASLVSGASRLAGQVASLPVSMDGGGATEGTTQAHYDAYNRHRAGKATPADLELLSQRTSPTGRTALEAFQYANAQRAGARGINDAFDLTGIVNQKNREGLNQDLAQGFGENWGKVTSGETGKVVSGLAGLIANAGSALVNNPSAVREYVLENAPQLFVGAFGKAGQAAMLASNVGYAVDEYQKGIENYQKANGGALPPEDVRQRMALQAASLAVAEEAGDVVGLGAAKMLGKTAEGATRESFLKSLKNVGKAAVEGAVGETPTEAYQQYMEGQVEGKDATPLEIYQAGVIGGASGGVLSGGGRMVHEAALPEGEKKPAPTTTEAVPPDVAELRKQAVESGDVSQLQDSAPDHAIAALYGHSRKADTSDEAKAQNLRKADDIVSGLERTREALAQTLAGPEQKRSELESLKRQLAKTPASNTDLRETLQAVIDMTQAELDAGPQDAAKTKERQAELERVDRQLAKAKEAHGLLKDLVSKPAEATTSKLLETAETDSKAADEVINLSMASPASLDPVKVKKLVDNQANALTPQQRDLLRQFAEARIAQNALRKREDVSNEIVDGSKDNLGLKQYQSWIGSAVATGDKKTAAKYLALLQNFLASHADKAKKVLAASSMKGEKAVVRAADGSWQIQDKYLPEAERAKNGAVNVRPNTNLGASIQKEAQAIAATAAALQAAYASKFNPAPATTTTTGAVNEQDLSPQGANPQSEREAAPAQADGKAGAASQPASSPDAGAVAGGVEGAGVGLYSGADGKPVVLYHGSEKGLKDGFKPGEAVYLTPSRTYAEEFTPLGKGEVGAFHARIGKPLVVDRAGEIDGIKYSKVALDKLRSEGYDAVVFNGRGHKPQVLVLDSAQLVPAETPSPARTSSDSTQPTGTSESVDRVSDAPAALTSVEGGQSTGEGTVSSQESPTAEQLKEKQNSAESTAELSQEPDTSAASSVVESPEGTTEDQHVGLQVLQEGQKYNEQFKGKKLAEIFRQLNRAAAWLKQKATPLEKARDISQVKPLVTMPGFLSRWTKDKGLIDQLFDNTLDEHEQHALLQFRIMANQWSEQIRKGFIKDSLPNSAGNKVKDDYLYKDPVRDLVHEDGTVDENLVTAVAYGAYAWLMEATMGPARKNDEAILAMHGLRPDDDVQVTLEGRKALNRMAAVQNTAVNGMGRLVVDALGLKVGQDASQDYLPNLTAGLGAHVMRLLESQGFIETATFNDTALNAFIEGLELPAFETRSYVRVTRKSEGDQLVLPDAVRAMRDATIGSGGVLERLFSAGHPRSEASTRPIPFTQEDAKRTDQHITEEQRQIIAEQQKVPHRIIPAMHRALKVLGDKVFLTAAGWQQLGDDKIQFENRDAVQVQNENLESQLQDAKTLVDGHPEGTAFYIAHEVWKNFRVGVATRNLNPQSSKLHRFMFARPEWTASIDLTNPEMVTHYLTAVAQAFGVKVDQQSNDKSAQWVLDWLNDPANTLVPLIEKLHRGEEFTPAEQQAIGEFAASKEGMQTLQALVSLGDYLAAFNAEGVTSFETTMLVGVDGKANGPMLTLLSLGAAPSAEGLFQFLHRGGFYRESDGVTNYSQWYGPANQDLYQDLAGKILGALDLGEKAVRTNLRGLSVITKNLLKGVVEGEVTSAGRNLAKTPQTAFNFGSTLKKSISGMTDALVQGVFDRIQSLATDPGVVKEGLTREKLIAAINHFIADPKEHIPADVTIEQLMNTGFSKPFKEQLKAGFTEFLGPVVQEVMKDYYGSLIERRNALNGQVRTAFTIYSQVYQDLRAREMERLMDEGEIAFEEVKKKGEDGVARPTGERRPLHDMTVAQEQALLEQVKAVLPLAHNAYSAKADDLDAGLYMAKSERTTGREAFHEPVIQFGQKFQQDTGKTDARGKPVYRETSQLKVRPLVVNEMSPGVAALAYLMHSFDSAVMHRSIKGTQTLNVHDEAANAADKVTTTARSINFQLWTSLVQFSPNTAAFQMLERSVVNLVKLAKEGVASPATLAAIATTLRGQVDRKLRDKITAENLATYVLTRAKMAQYEADKVRLEALAQMTSVDQYTWEGGEYRVTDKDREVVRKLLELHVEQGAKLSKETQQAADELGKLLATKKAEATQTTSQPASETTADAEAQPQASSPFGELGKPIIAPDKALLSWFKQNLETTAGTLIPALYQRIKGDKSLPNNEFNVRLLAAVRKVVPADLKVVFVTKDTPPIADAPQERSRAWLNRQRKVLYVVGPDFESSGLTPEVLLHELVHAATTFRIHSGDAAVKPYVQELEALLQLARERVQSEGLEEAFGAAVANVDELVAWGMTNRDFQSMVLSKIQVQSSVLGKLASAMQAFVATLAKLLGFKDAAAANGLGVLITNVSALMQQQSSESSKGPDVLSMASPTNHTYSTLDIFEALVQPQDNVTPTFAASLRGLLGGIVNSLHGPFGTYKAQLMKNTTDGELGVWFKAFTTGKMPFASKAIAAGFRISSQELFAIEQVEATVRAAMEGNEAQTKVAARELADLYQQVFQRLKPADFARITSSPTEARALYDFVFKMEKSSGDRSDYLARFAALALGHQGFNSLLKVPTTRDGRSIKDGKSFAEKVQIVFEKILTFFRDRVTQTFTGQHEDAKVKALVEQLVDIEAKQREKLANPDMQSKVISSLEEGAKSFAAALRDKAAELLEADLVKKSRQGIVKGASAMARTVVGGHVESFMTTLADFRDKNMEGQQNVVSGLLNEVRGPSSIMEGLLRGRKHQEQQRKGIIDGTSKQVLALFDKGGKDLSKKANAAVTQVLLRTGAYTLLNAAGFSMARLEVLLSDKDELQAEIDRLEAQLPADQVGGLAIFQAKTLAYTKVTGIARSKVQLLNAHQIARMAGSAMVEEITPSQAAQMEPVLEQLISLYGLAYSEGTHKTLAHQVLKAENARTDGGNGVQFLLQLQARLAAEALERNFKGNKTLMIHGYTPEIYNPYTDVKVANAQDGKQLEALGYKKGEEVRNDPHDPDQTRKHLYVMRDGPQQPWLSGIVAFNGMRSKGSDLHSGYLNIRTQEGLENATMNADQINARQPDLLRSAQIGRSYDPRKDNARYMVPTFNEAGEIVNWRDMMLETTKDTLLERDNRMEMVIGKLAGSVFDKATVGDVNRQAVEAVKQRFDAEYATDKDAYMMVGAKSSDPELRDIWRLLSDETRNVVREVWGQDYMMVRKDELDILFGYRKLSLADMWDKDPATRNLVEKAFMAIMTEIFGQKAALRVRQGERAWQEVVKEAKDNIVVKTGTVLLGNILSNFSLLWLRGVPLKDMIHHHLVALKGATAYLDDSRELQKLKMLRDTSYTQGKDTQIAREILRLEDAIARNPVTKLMEAGLMPSIVDDVEQDDDLYSYKSLFVRTTEKYTSKLHPAVLEAGKSLYLTHDTKIYQALSRATQLSDFVARYTLYQHLTTRTKDPMTADKALHDASESFINYDVPSHRAIQYGNDVGLLMFTKYFLRIQRVLGKVGKENPLRYYLLLGMNHFLTLPSNVLESLWINRITHNPLRMGALDYPATLKDVGLVSLELSLFQ